MNSEIPFVRNGIFGTVVAALYLSEGSGMGHEHLELQHIYVSTSWDGIDAMIVADYQIEGGDIREWLNRVHGAINYWPKPE